MTAARFMTSADRDYLMPTQEKLEWITPKISLMAAGDTASKPIEADGEGIYNITPYNPS
jgi:hypothetical protein